MDRLRIDKWLWAARFFKSRALATRACDLGRVSVLGQAVKPAREIRPGDVLTVKTEGGVFTVDVLGLSDIRGPAPVAQRLYRETEESRELRRIAAEERRAEPHFEPGPGRPTKRDRRQLGKLRGRA
jgi:ribosome-associated heat shock protein Hsp15